MRLTIVIIGALCRLTFDVTGHGEYWLFSTVDGLHIVVEASGHVRAPCHVAVTLPATDPVRMFFAEFDAEDGSALAAQSSWKWEPLRVNDFRLDLRGSSPAKRTTQFP